MVCDKISTIGEIILKNNYNSNQICALGGNKIERAKIYTRKSRRI